jgi:hypothetical protein
MYVLIEHSISDPESFFSTAESSLAQMPPTIKLHHTFPSTDGTRAVCLWEADRLDQVRDFIESAVGQFSRNEYFEVPNKEGVVNPRGERAQVSA